MTSPAAKRATRLSIFFFATLMLGATPVLAQQFVAINAPGANATLPVAINDLGQVVGYLYDSTGNQHGFLLNAGVYQTIDFPQALTTACTGINNNGYIVGTYNDVNNAPHGFSLINGIFTTIDDPAFPNGTYPSQISDPGLIAGVGFDAQNVAHGFSFANNTFTTIDYPGSSFTQILDMSLNGLEFVGVYGPPSYPTQPYQGFTDINGVFTSVTYPGSAST
jgi:probable HAF family extracellular repeat protein